MGQVYVIAATNRPDIVDPAMLRPGRLDRLLYVPLPSETGRLEILRAHVDKIPPSEDVDLPGLAREAVGFSGADLAALTREAAMLAIRNAPTPAAPSDSTATEATAAEVNLPPVQVTADLFAKARKRVSPSVGADERRDYEALALRIC